MYAGDFDLSVEGGDVIDGVPATVLQLLPTGELSEIATSKWNEVSKDSATISEHLYELRPAEVGVDGTPKVGLELESTFGPGPDSDTLVG